MDGRVGHKCGVEGILGTEMTRAKKLQVDDGGGCRVVDLWLKNHRFATQGGAWPGHMF